MKKTEVQKTLRALFRNLSRAGKVQKAAGIILVSEALEIPLRAPSRQDPDHPKTFLPFGQ